MPVHLRARLAALAGYPDPGICHSQEIMASRMHCVEDVGQDSATGWLHCVGCRLTSRRCSFLVSKLWRSVLRLRCTSGTMGIPPRPAASRALLGVLRPRRRGCGAQTQVPTRLLPIPKGVAALAKHAGLEVHSLNVLVSYKIGRCCSVLQVQRLFSPGDLSLVNGAAS